VFRLSTFPTYTGRFFSIRLLDAFSDKGFVCLGAKEERGSSFILFFSNLAANLDRSSLLFLITIDRVIIHNRSNDFLDRLKKPTHFFPFHFPSTEPNRVKNKNKIICFFLGEKGKRKPFSFLQVHYFFSPNQVENLEENTHGQSRSIELCFFLTTINRVIFLDQSRKITLLIEIKKKKKKIDRSRLFLINQKILHLSFHPLFLCTNQIGKAKSKNKIVKCFLMNSKKF
jgi:hypothetical protein